VAADDARVMTRARLAAGACALALALGAAVPAHAGSPSEAKARRRLTDANTTLADARADLDRFVQRYQAAALAADEASVRALEALVRRESMQAAVYRARDAFDERVRAAYMDAGTDVADLILGATDLRSLAARLPYAESALREQTADVRDLARERETLAAASAEADRAQRAVMHEQASVATLEAAIEARVTAAERLVAVSRAAVAQLRERWRNAKRRVGSMLGTARHRRGEAMYQAAASFLGPRKDCSVPHELRATGQRLAGASSWYGPGFYGRPTASGAIHTIDRYNVAHRELPLGLMMLIRLGDRCVVALLNDRGPYVDGRILDLGAASAQAVKLSGVKNVTATILVRR
jgi:rare lipoprotein A (peptidoglycan hydrolase)